MVNPFHFAYNVHFSCVFLSIVHLKNCFADYMLIWVVLIMHTICIIYFTLFSLFYSAICTTHHKKHNERVTSKAKSLRPERETQSKPALNMKRFPFISTEN